MNIKLRNLMLAAVTAMASNVFADTGVPGFSQDDSRGWTAKYYHASIDSVPPADWYTADFNDSEWGTLQGPIYRSSGRWNDYYTAYWLRSHFTLDSTDNLESAVLKIFHDDGCEVYLNGTKIYEDENVIYDPAVISLNPSFFKNGENVLAVFVADTGAGDAFIDYGINLYKTDILEVEVEVPGTLGDVVLSKVENFSDVQCLRVSGKLNADDVSTLSSRMTDLRILDLAKADLKEIGNSAFENNRKIAKVILPETLETVGQYAFNRCYALTEVVFQEGLKDIKKCAFESTALKEVVLPEGLISLGESSFRGCAQNTYISFPSTLKTIHAYAFNENTSLAGIDFSEGLENIGSSAFFVGDYNGTNEYHGLTKLVFPSTLKTIDSDAFAYRRSLRDVRFNEGLTQIGDNAFYCCDSLREVTLPSTLVRADASPFDYCKNLYKVTCLSIEPPYMTDQIPYGCSMAGRELYVPSLSVNLYKQTAGWDKFPSINSIDAFPDDIIITRDERLTLPGNLPAAYKPDLSLNYSFINNGWSYGRLELNGDANVSLRKFSMVMDPRESASYHPFTSLINNVSMRADSVEMTLFPYPSRWTFICLPFDVRVGDIRANKEGTTHFAVRRYSGTNRAAGESGSTWQDLGEDDIMKAGEGHIIQAVRYIGNEYQYYVGLVLPSSASDNINNVFLTTDARTVLEEHPSEQEQDRGWNMIGNPYPCYYDSRFMDFEAPFTVWDDYNWGYRAYSPLDDSYVFTPGEAFFVQCPVGKTDIIFDVEGRQKTREVRDLTAPSRIAVAGGGRKVFNLTLSGQTGEDVTRIVFNEAASMGYESNRDAAKFFSHEEKVGQIYTVAADVEYAINERPAADGLVRLGVRIGSSGSHTVALKGDTPGYQVWLDDALNGESMRLDGTTGYSFISEPCETTDRFTLRFVGADVNAVESMGSESADGDGSGIYGIDGSSVTHPESGSIYIKNRKKVVVK